MIETTGMSDYGTNKAIGIWLLIVASLVFIMVLVGGATRLTESGLSITEWQPVSGVLPPLNPQDWADAFEKYQEIPQARIVNADMTLEEFKTIYWWEWTHRFIGRLIGIVFLIPFLYFLIRRQVPGALKPRLWILFGLGALQGGLGWFMVMSGLVDRIDVSHYRLAAHLNLAFIIYAYAMWLCFGLLAPQASFSSGYQEQRATSRVSVLSIILVLQLVIGAFVAGLDAGRVFNTWPLMNDSFVPDGLMALSPWYLNFTESYAGVQFSHRILAYLLIVGGALYYLWAQSKLKSPDARNSATLIFLTLSVQALLGIWALLNAVPVFLGVLHQAGALMVITAFVWHYHCIVKRGLSDTRRAEGSDTTLYSFDDNSISTAE